MPYVKVAEHKALVGLQKAVCQDRVEIVRLPDGGALYLTLGQPVPFGPFVRFQPVHVPWPFGWAAYVYPEVA